jgi:hypothetical protein
LCSHSRTSQHFMAPEGSLPCSQESTTDPYPEPYKPNPYHPILSKIHFNIVHPPTRSRDSVVGIATSYGLDDREVGVRVPTGVKNFLFSKSSRPALRSTQPPLQWVPGIKRPGSEVDHSPPTSAEVKKMWIYTSTPHTPSWRSA